MIAFLFAFSNIIIIMCAIAYGCVCVCVFAFNKMSDNKTDALMWKTFSGRARAQVDKSCEK